ERAVVLCRGDYIDVDDLALSELTTASESTQDIRLPGLTYEPVSLEEIERRHIAATLQETGWNKSRAAAILGIERSTLDRKIKKYGLSKAPV
ncbi:MAG TPA: sigma-54-dependent Fis family transcriptional regulator, partial [Planctomycetaceae bacterium]|nr:sigma-54-dependent Fis family transcriptional regulator [Planctomycetaceae bacterium]